MTDKRLAAVSPPPGRGLVATELDETSYPEFRERIRIVETGTLEHSARYPGYPCVVLPRPRKRFWIPLESTLEQRRSRRELSTTLPSAGELGRVLAFAHGVNSSDGRGPTPSSGKLCALELYLASFRASWLPHGTYHYDRAAHCLWRVANSETRDAWQKDVPSLEQVSGGGLLWLLIGDVARVEAKYGHRSSRLLLLEAGHLMQNLCLMSECMGRCTVPLGGFFERNIARRIALQGSDAVLYAGLYG
jgi:SagB-type dehydrogenase family enzyme